MSTPQGAPTDTASLGGPSWARALDAIGALPEIGGRLLAMAVDGEASPTQLADALASEPRVAEQLLAALNSGAFGCGREVATVAEAITLYGRSELRVLALGIVVFEALEGGAKGDRRRRDALWRHGVATAAAAQFLGGHVGRVNLEEVYVAALLHDLGKLALERIPSRDARGQGLELDHEAAGDSLADRWDLPAGIRAAIRHHHDAEEAAELPTPLRRVVAIVRAADILAERCGYGAHEVAGAPEPDELTRELLARLDHGAVVERVRAEVEQCAAVFRYAASDDPHRWQTELYATHRELARAGDRLAESHRIERRCAAAILGAGAAIATRHPAESLLAEIVRSLGFERASLLTLAGDGRSATLARMATAHGRGSRLVGKSFVLEGPSAIPNEGPRLYTPETGPEGDRWCSFFSVPAVVVSPVVEEGAVRHLLATDRGAKSEPAGASRDADLLAHQLCAPALALLLQNARLHERAEYLAATDALTDVSNRTSLLANLERIAAEARRSHETCCAAIVHVDELGKANDAGGDAAGDAMLRLAARAIRGSCRGDDVIGRLGGGEFCVVLPKTTLEEGRVVAERIRASVEASGREGAAGCGGRAATVSVGIAALSLAKETQRSLLARAAAAAERAKGAGRNRVAVGDEATR